jgi:hypothetical protein
VRPEKLRVVAPGPTGEARTDSYRVLATVERVQYLGHRTEYRVRVGGHDLVAWQLSDAPVAFRAGDTAAVEWRQADMLLFGDEVGR